jgi:hypothetical protein
MGIMGTVKLIVGFLVIVGVVIAGSQIIPPEMANYQFQDDLRNLAMMAGSNPHRTDDDTRTGVVSKAQEHGITITPEQITVTHIGTPGAPAVYLAADYSVPVNLPGYSFTLHFTPSSGNKGF